MNEFKSRLLEYLDITAEDYEELSKPVTKDDLPNVQDFANFDTFMARIEQAITNDEQILVYGDYDADGILATIILKKAFLMRGKDIFTMIPSRYKDGYGLNTRVVEKIKKRNISLIITVDNGVSQHEAIALARSYGIDVLVSDHHELNPTLPDAIAVLHPDLSDLPPYNSCGAYMALVISHGLLGYYDDYLLTLAGIATVADMMPLKDRNRTVVRVALANANENKYISLTKLNDSTFFDEDTFGRKIAPKINALGRLSQNYEANVLIEYFTTSDIKRIYEISTYITQVYEERKKMSAVVPLDQEELSNPAIVIISEELEGVLGLLAQNYLTNYNKPAIVFTPSSENPLYLKGSARSSGGFSIVEAFSTLKDYIIASGGHPEAGGLTIKSDDFVNFKNGFNEFAKNNPLKEKKQKWLNVDISELTPENYQILNNVSPFGFKWPTPQFSVAFSDTSTLTLSRDEKHIISTLPSTIKLIGFNLGSKLADLNKYKFYGTFSRSEFRGNISIDFKISNIE